MTTSYPCPRCGATAALPDGCRGCGAGPDLDAAEVIRLDAEIAGLTRRLHEARAQVTALDRQLHDTRTTRNQAAARVVASRPPTPAATRAPVSGLPPLPQRAPTEPRLSTRTVQNLLFTLGGLLLVVAAAVFTAVAWAQVGVTGRALLLTGATVAVLAVPPFAVRRGLTAAAETLAAVGLLMILLDGYAAWAVDFLWVRHLDIWGYVAAVLAFTAVLALGYSTATKLRGPRIAALLLAQPVLPLLAAAGDATLTGWSLAFTGTATLDLAGTRIRAARHTADRPRIRPARRTLDGLGVLAHACAAVAGGAGALLGLYDLSLATRPGPAAVAAVVLLLPLVLLLVWTVLDRRPWGQAFVAGLVVVTAGFASARWAWTLPIEVRGSGWQSTRLAVVALVLAAVAARLPRTRPALAPTPWSPADSSTPAEPGPTGSPASDGSPPVSTAKRSRQPAGPRRWLPGEAGFGAWIGTLVVAVAPAATVLAAATVAAIRGVQAARPVFGAPLDRAVTGPGADLLVAAVVTAVAYALVLSRRSHANLALTALAVVALIAVPAFGLAWWAATVAGLLVATIALALAARARTTPDVAYRAAFCLAGAMQAVVTGFGNATVIATVSAVLTVLGVGAALGLRNTPRGTDVGAGAILAGLLGVPATVWLALFAADVAITWRVRVTLGTAVLLCLVAHTIHRRIPGYGPQSLGVALVVVGFAPGWAAAGTDPTVLYQAAALLLIVALLPLPGARSAASAVAAVLPGLALLALTSVDLAVVLLEPWAGLRDIWSGIPPRQSPVAWATLAALTTAGVAAAAAGWLLARPGRPSGVATSDAVTSHSGPGDLVPGAVAPGTTGTPPGSVTGVTAGQPAPGERAAGAAAGAGDTGWSAKPAVVAVCAAMPFAAVLMPLVFAAAGAAWPAVPIAGLVTGLGGLLAIGLVPVRHTAGALLAVLFGALAATGIAGSAAGHGATIAAFVLVLVTGLVAGWSGRRQPGRVVGWFAGSVAVVVVAYTIADLADLGAAGPPLFVLAAAAPVVALEGVLATRRPAEAWMPLVVGHASALVAVLLTESLGWAALVCKLWALVLTVRALRPGETRRGRFGYAVAAGSVALAGWWLLLSSRDVATTEFYTLPAAVLALAAGWFARRARPELSSWSAYGAALTAVFLPTLAVVANSTADEPHYVRRLLLGMGALLVLLAGARARLRAPVVTGGGTLLLVAAHELVQFWDLLPRWVPLAVGGLLLVGIATTMEQRRRDLARLRAVIAGMA